MTTTATEKKFEGPFRKLLDDLATLIEWLQTEHDKSFVRAGDNKVYAFGGGGFVLVLDESVWDGQIEMITPNGGLAIKRDEGGSITVTSSDSDDQTVLKQRLKEGIDGIRRYYENRYWSTPRTSA